MTMTLGFAATAARERLRSLEEIVRQFTLTLDDVPEPGNEPAIVESLRAATADLEHDVTIAISGWERPAAGSRWIITAATGSQEAMNRAARRLHEELASHDAVAEVIRIGSERGGAWHRWSDVVCRVLEECKQRHYDVSDALAGCFTEYVDHDISLRGA
jgi:hypothetical protein